MTTTNNTASFEIIWETSEGLYKDDPANIQAIITELTAKLMVYKSIDANKDMDATEKKKAKEYMMGKLLMAITHLSLKDDINVYGALKDAIAAVRTDKMEALLKKAQ